MPTRENSPIDFLPERIAMRFLPDRFTLTLIATVLLASFLPARGEFVGWLNALTIAAIALLFSCTAPSCRARPSWPAAITGGCICG
jgi:hypothetical protein